MKIGVVIPNRNYARFLGEALKSVVNQTRTPDDIIVVDGESADDSEAVAKSWRVRFLSIPRGPTGQARNVGIRSMGLTDDDAVVPLDSDDWLEPTFIERCEERLLYDPGIGAVGTGLVYRPGGNVQWPDEPLTAERLAGANRMFTSSMFRVAAWSSAGGYEESTREMYEDWDLWLGMALKGWKLDVVHEPLFNYRLHPASDTASCGNHHPRYVENMRKKRGLA